MKSRDQEICEAIEAADETLYDLNGALDCLKSASGWGMIDMLGGGFLTTLMKHGKIDDAKAHLLAAKESLSRFADELRDVDEIIRVDIQVDDFLGFADFFFDGVIADWMVQSRIGESRRQTEEAIRRVKRIRDKLEAMR